MPEEYDYRRLREIQQQERESSSLVPLPAEFYQGVSELTERKRLDTERTRALHDMREFENMLKVIRDIHMLRTRKVVFRALTSPRKHSAEGMTKEEHALYDSVCGLLEQNGAHLSTLGGGGIPEREEGRAIKKVRILKDIPAYKGVDNAIYGPFKPGDESALPQTEAEWLLRGKLAQGL